MAKRCCVHIIWHSEWTDSIDGFQILRKVLAEIQYAEWYALIADETRDVSGAGQFAISLHWVATDYNMYEDLIGQVEVESTTAESLSSTIKDTLLPSVLQ